MRSETTVNDNLYNFTTMANLYLIVPVLLLAFFVENGEPVRCWTCSSELNPICNDPFRQMDGYDYRLENCDTYNTNSNYLTTAKSACMKKKMYYNGQLIISRGCTWKRQDDYTNTCPNTNNGLNEVTSFCETCEYDGCNGAATLGKTLALIIASLGILLFK